MGTRVAYNLRLAGQVFDGQAGPHANGFREYDPAIGRYSQSDPIGLRGGLNTYAYALSNPIAYFDPFGLSACTDFVKALADLWSAMNSSMDLAQEMLNRRNTTLGWYDGFKPPLVSGGQGGAVSRHIYGHGGAALVYPYGPGATASYANQAIDYLQQFQKGRTQGEAAAEIAEIALHGVLLMHSITLCRNGWRGRRTKGNV
ncbi:MAG: RHS repeat-associated core domain-containing protein [Steroidobacteraceae bacterium]